VDIKLLNIVCRPNGRIHITHRLAVIDGLNDCYETLCIESGAESRIIQNAYISSFGEDGKILAGIPDTDRPAKAYLKFNGGRSIEFETGPVKQFSIYIMPTSHLCFGYFTGLPEHNEAGRIVAEAVDMLEADPGYRWNVEFTRGMQNLLLKYPEKAEAVKNLYLSGRLTVSPMWTPSMFEFYDAESHIRQLAQAQWWLRKNLGRISGQAMGCDSGGFDPAQPQIFRQAGVDMFFRGRYTLNGKDLGSPFLDHRGSDGTVLPCITTHIDITGGGYLWPPVPELWQTGIEAEYGSQRFGSLAETMDTYVRKVRELTGIDFFAHFAASDQGTIDRDLHARLVSWNRIFITPSADISDTGTMTKTFLDSSAIRDIQGQEQPSWAQVDAAGLKLTHDFSEASHRAVEAEKAACLDHLMNAVPYPKDELDICWQNILDEQHHEQLGHAVDEALKYSGEKLGRSIFAASSITKAALSRIAGKIDFRGKSSPIVVFNLLNWDRKDIVETDDIPEGDLVTDSRGISVASERTGTGKIRFTAEVPGMGYNTYYINGSAKNNIETEIIEGDVASIANEFYSLDIDLQNGCIKKLCDLELKRDILLEGSSFDPMEIAVNEDSGKGWCSFHPTGKRWRFKNDCDHKIKIVKSVTAVASRITIERDIPGTGDVSNNIKGSKISVVYELPVGIKRFDVRMETDWDSAARRELRLYVPLTLKDPEYSYDTLLSTVDHDKDIAARQHLNTIVFGNDTNEMSKQEFDWRVPCRFVSAYEKTSDTGISFTVPMCMLRIADEIPSFSLIEERTDYYNGMIASQKGIHKFNISLTSHSGNWKKAKAWKLGWEKAGSFDHLIPIPAERSYPCIDEKGVLFGIAGENIVLTAMKMAHEGEDIIVRVYNANGEGDTLNLNNSTPFLGYVPFVAGQIRNGALKGSLTEQDVFDRKYRPLAVLNTSETDLLEDPKIDLPIDGDWHVRPFGIMTVRLKMERPQRSWVPTYEIRLDDNIDSNEKA
jgi:hypothetical protein